METESQYLGEVHNLKYIWTCNKVIVTDVRAGKGSKSYGSRPVQLFYLNDSFL